MIVGLVLILAQWPIDRFTQIELKYMVILNQLIGIDTGALRLLANTPYINMTARLRVLYYRSQLKQLLSLKK